MSISVFIADDHAVVREGLKVMLETQPDLKVVGTAVNGREAVEHVARLLPDVAILDIAMPELNGIEAARLIRTSSPTTRTLILSMHSTSEHICQALRAGATGYLLKESAVNEIVDAVHSVHLGRRYLSQKIQDTIFDDYILHGTISGQESPIERLSGREREVLQLVVEGRTSVEIAKSLNLSAKTVETYRSRIMEKLEVHDLTGLIKFAIRHGLTNTD
ncbi:MAG TPA: response regulator transcription factor [Nitrospirota bacterium]|nr:response regulator transcription factor [Nitrospirota bacterium]